MYEDFISQRLSSLRQQKGVSAREMSLSIGQNVNYINHVESKKMLPSMQTFFYICEYLSITPSDFFDGSKVNPEQITHIASFLKKLDPAVLNNVYRLITSIENHG